MYHHHPGRELISSGITWAGGQVGRGRAKRGSLRGFRLRRRPGASLILPTQMQQQLQRVAGNIGQRLQSRTRLIVSSTSLPVDTEARVLMCPRLFSIAASPLSLSLSLGAARYGAAWTALVLVCGCGCGGRASGSAVLSGMASGEMDLGSRSRISLS